MWRYGLVLIVLAGLVVSASPAIGQQAYVLEFSIDIGSDCELSDPNADGDEAFDPGDVYWRDGTAVLPPGQNGQKDDKRLFGNDPSPDPRDPTTAVPIGYPEAYSDYFDLDGHDQLDFSLHEILAPNELPVFEFPSATVFEPKFLAISYDDDMAPGWPMSDVPVSRPSQINALYGTDGAGDEVIELELSPIGGGMYRVLTMIPVRSEVGVHASLQPSPDAGEADDDDVDSLDIVEGPDMALFWLFSADHEANMTLNPGDIYEEVAGAAVKVIDHKTHLGLADGVDIDAFEFVWMELDAAKVLTLLFSVDQNDPLTTNVDESGGLDPRMIYYSHLTGSHAPLLKEPLLDDVDALANWFDPLVSEEEFDWGDAPMLATGLGYPTLAAQNGANHVIVPNMMMGASIDSEPDGQPDLNALGDDNAGVPDDEDGVVLTSPMIPGGGTTATVTVVGPPGYLNAWVDFNNNGVWGDVIGEQIFLNQVVAPTANYLVFAVPAWAQPGPTFSRWRYSTQASVLPTGAAPDGEVEDYENVVEEDQRERDWGDAPDQPYPTLAASNGANHVIVSGILLGTKIDSEPDGQQTLMAHGDDILDGNDDEDGVILPIALFRGTTAPVIVTASVPGWLQAWVDLNGNGSWADAGEQIITNVPVGSGPNFLTFGVPTAATKGLTYMRFRYSTSGGLSFTGPAPDGEVEDYRILLTCRGDFDLDGDVDLDDFVILKLNFGTGTTYGQGDADGDGDVDLDDFVILKLNFGC